MNLTTSIAALCAIFCLSPNYVSCDNSNIWAVLHCGYFNYRYSYGMESSVYRLYQLLVKNGIPKSQIIVITPNKIAFDERNLFPGVMVHGRSLDTESAPNYYENVEIDYNCYDLTANQFYEILKGNETAVQNVAGSKKVVKTGPKDTLLFYSSTLGGVNEISFNPNFEGLMVEQFIPFIENMSEERRFGKMYMMLDSKYPGAIFDNYMDTDKNIFVQVVGGRYSSQYVTDFNPELQAFTATVGSKVFLENLERHFRSFDEKADKLRVTDHYSSMMKSTIENFGIDPPNMYGNLKFAQEKLSEFFGKPANKVAKNKAMEEEFKPAEIKFDGLVPFEEALMNGGDISVHEWTATKKLMNNIIAKSCEHAKVNSKNINKPIFSLKNDKLVCYREVMKNLHRNCFTDDTYIMLYMNSNKFAKMCEMGISQHVISSVACTLC